MADPQKIHEILKSYVQVVAKSGGAVLPDPSIVKELNTLSASPKEDAAAKKRLQELLAKQIKMLKSAKNEEAAAELTLISQAAKLVDDSADKLVAVLGRIKPEVPSGGGKGAKLHGTGNQIIEPGKPAVFKPEAEQGDLSLRSLFVKMARNPDLVMKAVSQSEAKQLEDDRTQWGVARLSQAMILKEDNAQEFQEAAPSTIWLGFVRIGRRVGKTEDRIALVQLSPEAEPGRKFVTKPQLLAVGQTWHSLWLNSHFAAKPDPAIKLWNGWTLQDLKKDKRIDLSDTGCFFGFFLIKAKERSSGHYWNFRCASLNQPANAQMGDAVPDMPMNKMSADQRAMYHNLITAARGNHEVPIEEIKAHFPGVKLHRAALDLQDASKKMPLSWAKAVHETISKLSR